jgi:ParB family chromosome partitioning protein
MALASASVTRIAPIGSPRRWLGDGHDVGRNAVLFVSPQLPVPYAALNLVEDQRRAVLVAQVAQTAQEILRGRINAALALYRLNDNRRRIGADGGAGAFQVVVFRHNDARHERLEAVLILVFRRQRQRANRAPVKRPGEADHLHFVGQTLLVSSLARELDRALVGFRPAVAEEHPVGERLFAEQFRQFDLRRGQVQIARMDQAVGELLRDGAQVFVAITQRVHGDPGHPSPDRLCLRCHTASRPRRVPVQTARADRTE